MNVAYVKDEILRNEALQQYEVLNSASDATLDDIAQLAAGICNAPVAAVSFLGAGRIWLKSRFGTTLHELSLGSLPCETTILGDTLYQIPDARLHPDYAAEGISLEGKTYNFYAGVPLTTPNGVNIGALFVLDQPSRTLDPGQISALSSLARQVMTRLELNRRVRQMDRISHSRQRAENTLSVERNFVSAVLDTVSALVVVFDPAGRIVRFNRACEAASGYDLSALSGHYLWDKLIPRNEIPEAIEQFERLRSGEFPVNFENQWLHRNGTLRRIAWTATALRDSHGQITFLIATGIDVTIQRAAENTLRESEARYRMLIEGSLGMVCTHDLRGIILSINERGAETIGLTAASMIGRSLEDFIVPERRNLVKAYLEDVSSAGEARGLLHLMHADGGTRTVAYRNKLVLTPGRAPYVLGFGIDVTEQIKIESRLEKLAHQSDSILESIGDGIYGIDLAGRITITNSAADQMLGYNQGELLGRKIHELIHHTRADGTPYPSSDSPLRNCLTNFDTVRVSGEIFWRKDGTSFFGDYVARPQIDTESLKSGEIKAIGAVVAFTDTTERRALDRMKDEFISTVSHELRTPLTSVRGALGLLSGGTLANRPDKAQQMLEIAINNSDRLIRLINDILDIERIGSGKAELHASMCNVEDLLRRAANQQQNMVPKPDIHIFVSSDGVSVWADPDRILQTLNNLISNAIKFSFPGGDIHLSARALDDNEAIIEVSDQGRGIPADKLEKIFDRFHQVDASDSRDLGGTGLGLAICRSIVTQHGGRIWATNNPVRGATFHFTLPTKSTI
ncbi:MAG TPA: PAS domain S-box protein [Edaphobacter sp.]|nr:PAS domain S-box protein [Edaphobacter sp.]